MKRNKFSKALNHLKSKKLDEKIKKLEEAAPTNSMSGIYQQSPRADAAFRLGELDPPRRFVAAADGSWPAGIPGTAGEPYYDRPAGYFNGTVDWETITEPKFGYDAAQGNNTDGLIDPVTNAVKTQLPPNSRSFILGPLVDGFVPNHIGDAFTRIGYIEKDTRQFVLLALIDGEWISGLNERFGGAAYPVWGGTSTGFSQVNPNFTLDMALWFRNEMLKGRYVKNVSYNAVGGIPQQQSSNPDAPQPLGGNGVGGGSGEAGQNPDGTGAGTGSGGEPNAGTPQGDPDPGKDPGENDLWGMGANPPTPPSRDDFPRNRNGNAAYRRARRKYEKEFAAWSKAQGNRPTPKPTPDPQGGRGGGTGNPTNRRGSGARNRGRGSEPTPPTGGYTPRPQGGRGGGQGNPTNPRGTGARPTPTPTPSPKPTGGYTPRPQGGRGGGQGNPTNPRGTGAKPTPRTTSQPDYQLGNEGQGNNKFSQFITKGLKGLNKVLEKITNNPIAKVLENSVPTKIIADTITDTIFGVNDSSSYNGQLALQLFNNVLTGNNAQIKLTPKGKKAMFDSIDADALADGLQIRPPSETSHENAIRPNGKKENVLTGGWEAQGGSEFSYDPETGLLTIHSNKMLRQMDGDVVNSQGKTVNFEDIPNPTSAQIKSVVPEEALKNFFELTTNVPGVKAGFDKDTAVQMMMDGYPEILKALYNFAVEGTASNAVQLRKELLKKGLTKQTQSEKEGEGFGGYTYSQESMPINKLKPEVRNVILKKINQQNTLESYNIQSKKRILREIRQPLKEIKELPKTTKLKGYKPNFKGKLTPQNTPDVTSSKKSDRLVMAKNAEGQLWSVGDKYFKGWETTNRMNHVYSRVGESDKFFEQITANNSADVERKMQEHLNHVYHNKAMLQIDSNYQSPFGDNIDEQETYDNKINDPLFTKVAKRLKKEIDYEKKPAKAGYPNEAPPKIDPNTGMHPKFGKRYKYDKLDPHSAESMPTQDDPEIDANVKKAIDNKRKARKLKNLMGKK